MAQWRQKMSDSEARELQVFMLAAEENYAHARDHESLRAQVTATLVAAAFVLIGLAIDKGVVGPKLVFVTGSAVLSGWHWALVGWLKFFVRKTLLLWYEMEICSLRIAQFVELT
jgi:hypothetical protein